MKVLKLGTTNTTCLNNSKALHSAIAVTPRVRRWFVTTKTYLNNSEALVLGVAGSGCSLLFSPLHPQKLIRMNMPVTEAGTVHFTTTLFALIRESLSIKMGPGKLLLNSL